MKKLGLVLAALMMVATFATAQTTIFSDNLSSLSGWTLSPTAGWTLSSAKYNSASYSAYCDNVNPYAASQNNYMTRSVNLSGYTSATLKFYIWQYTESGYDYVYAQYSTNSGSTWTTAWSRAGSYQSWAQQSVTIPTTANMIRFWFKSDGSVQNTGAYIDDVVLTATGAATPTLVISSTSWAPVAAGATSSAISVTNSGTTSVIAYTVASNQTWLTVSSAGGNTPGSFTMTAAANTGAARSATVTVTATTAGVTGSPKTIAVSQAAAVAGQNDAGTGADAGNDFATATLVSPGSWTGCYLDATDRNDYYKFSVTSGQVIKVKVTPPAAADFDLYLYNPSQTQVASATGGTGVIDSVVYTATVTGTFYAKAYEYSGTGNYSLLISVGGGTTPTTILAINTTSWAPVAAGGTSSAVSVTNSGTSGSVIAYTVASNQTWLTVSSASGNTPGSFTMTASANTGAARSATVTVAATGQTSKTIAVSQAAGSTPSGAFKYICLKAGQGDAAVLVSPTGKVALIDGSYNNTQGLVIWKFLRDSIRTHHLDYIFTSHLHSDHIGGTDLLIDSLCAHGMDSIVNGVYDRGGAYGSGTDYTNYNTKAGAKRRTATLGQTFDLGGGLNLQVVCLKGKTISGDSVVILVDEENGKSMGLLITCNGFRLISAGDIAGYNSGDYKNVESILAPDIGEVNVLHVNHHSSASSSNPTWISTLNPQASLISLGAGNSYGYPKAETLTRLTSDPGLDNHIYQTETGTGGTIPSGRGHVCNSNIWIVVNASTYTVWGESYSIAKGGDIFAEASGPQLPIVSDYSISAVSPNPVRGPAAISYQLRNGGQVTLDLYNMMGQKVRTLVSGYRSAGSHAFTWNGATDRGLASGVYLFRMAVAADGRRYESSRKVLLMK